MLSAENCCWKGKTGHVWSLKLVTAAQLVWYWKMQRSNQLNNCATDDYLIQLSIDLGIQLCQLTTAVISPQVTQAQVFLKLLNPMQLSYAMTI
eukprot:4174106-Ditylum_brightwellii.AAC.1